MAEQDLYKMGICASLREALDNFVKETERDADGLAGEVWRKKIEELTAILEELDHKEKNAA